jgi:glucokinase
MFETLVSGPHITRMAREAIAAGRESSLDQVVDFKTKDVGTAALAGDEVAHEVIERAAALLGIGIVNLLHLFNPQRLVIGGGVTKLGAQLFDPMWAAIRQHVSTPAYLDGFDIVPAELGADTGLIGAAILALTDGGRGDLTGLAERIARGA